MSTGRGKSWALGPARKWSPARAHLLIKYRRRLCHELGKDAKVYRLDMRKSNPDGATLKDATGEGMLLGGAVLCNTTMPDGQIVWSGCSP